MTFRFTARKAFIALIVSFLFHNIEEAIYICSYPVESPVSFIKPASCNQFLWAVSIISIIVVVLFMFAMHSRQQAVYLFISTAIASGLALNAMVPHIIIALYNLSYTPGLVTAVLLIFPLGLLTLFKNRPNFTSWKQFYRCIGISLAVGYLIFALVMGLVHQIIQ